MPKTSTYALNWLPEQGRYVLYAKDQAQLLEIKGQPWVAWLAGHAAFAFRGQQGHLTLLKESRARGEEGYWYAYRSQGGRTVKKYLGRSSKLTPQRLEEMARTLMAESRAVPEKPLEMREAAEEPQGLAMGAAVQPAPIQSAPLLAPKLRTPQLRSSLVARARLLARLDAGLERKLTLLSASAGFGKTTLVSQWVAECGKHADAPLIAWVSLDSGDNDPVRFWRYVITACQALLPDSGQAALAHLQAPPSTFEPATLEVTLTIFLNELAQSGRRGMLVLEDYHVITAPRIAATLTFLLDHLPATLHLVLIARSDPALPLAKLRARGELSEIRAADLRFSQEEASDFLQQALALPLSPQAITHLETRLEGWAAGLRLVALALQGHATPEDIERFLTSLVGSHHSILAFFVTEVLDAQPEPIQRFLLHTSLLRRLTGSLCDAVTGTNASTQMLETLERANLFLEPLDSVGQWYRYHALFAESMQHEARRRLGEDELRVLASRASLWYEQQDQLAEAIEMAFQAQQTERSASLIERVSATMHLEYTNEFYTLHRWLEQLPEAAFQQRPALCLEYVMVLIFAATARPFSPATQARVEKLLHMAEEYAHIQNDLAILGNVLASRSIRAWYLGQADQALTYARQALEWLPEDDLQARSTSLSVIGRMEVLAGHFDTARHILLETRAMCAASGNRTSTRAMTNILSGVCIEQGTLYEAETHFQQVLTEAREQGDFDDVAHAQMGLAQLAYEWNELEIAQQRAQEALEIGTQLVQPAHQANATLMLACVEHAQGRSANAQQRLAKVRESTQPHHMFQIYREAQTWQARFQLAAGDLAAVQHWVDTRLPRDEMLPMAQYMREELLVVRFWIVQGETERALELLERILRETRESQHTRGILETQILMALAYSTRKQAQEAVQTLQAALTMARPGGYTRIFLDEGAKLAVLLRAVLAHTREKALITYMQSILHAFAREPGNPNDTAHPDTVLLNEPLSPQERRVLRLLAAGRSNPEIASELVVSVNTIRTQVQSIYRKLNISNRVAASETARTLKLL